MTFSDELFRKSTYRDELHAFLLTDCGKEFVRLLEKRPAHLPAINGIHHTDAVVARMYAEVVGANGTVQRIKDLAEPWVDQTEMSKASDRPQWADNVPEPIRLAYEQHLKNQQQS